jgi:hypothetical protein
MRNFAAASLAVGALVTGLGTAGAGGGPILRVTNVSPLTIRGLHFHPREHVRVTLAASSRYTHSLRASRSGSFSTVFQSAKVGDCESFVVRATGNEGSLAVVKRGRPECGTEIAPP